VTGQDPADSRWAQLYAACRPRSEVLVLDGGTLAVSIWDHADDSGAEGRGRDVVLVHGGAAQRTWWDHIAPLLRGAGRIIAFDLTGHGDSSRRRAYSFDSWAGEVAAVAAAYCRPRPALVGHSMGGLVSVHAAQQAEDRYAAVMALDSPLQRMSNGHVERRAKIASRPVRSYATAEAAREGYRTYPPVVDAPPEVMAHVADSAYEPVGERWALKFDPLIYHRPQAPDDFVRRAAVPTQWVRAQQGFIDDRMAERISTSLGPVGELVEVPMAGHHLTLEQPTATAWLISVFLQRLGPVDR
jgi:pimeloyl-ACP methyl ester carboxylesterase